MAFLFACLPGSGLGQLDGPVPVSLFVPASLGLRGRLPASLLGSYVDQVDHGPNIYEDTKP